MILPQKEKIYITGQQKLSGTVKIPGSKNAALPILASILSVKGLSTLANIPEISDTKGFINIMKGIGVKVSKTSTGETQFDCSQLTGDGVIEDGYICKMRSSIMFLAPILARFGEVKMDFPGGCVLGKRSVDTHLMVFEKLGAEIIESKNYLHLKLPKGHFEGGLIVFPEMSVTATENAIIAAASAQGTTTIRLAAAEPHVQNLCEFLLSTGVKISGIGSHTLIIEGGFGKENILQKAHGRVCSDYLQAGTYLLAGILTNSEITVEDVEEHHLDSFLERLEQTGAKFTINRETNSITTKSLDETKGEKLTAVDIQTGVFPKFATDLHPQFAVLLSQCEGRSKIFETLFERKFAYLLELEKMGANVEIQNPHVFYLTGKKHLQGVPVASQDIRAGAAMILAALVANGETEISNIHYIHRGYEDIVGNLKKLGAKIEQR
jgi:UDP-N-acetylglucosamine 1-carboxyvinyltransferase